MKELITGFKTIQRDRFGFDSTLSLTKDREPFEKIDFQNLINTNNFKEGELVEVSDSEQEPYKPRIYLCAIPGNANQKYICVTDTTEFEYKTGGIFHIKSWKHIRKIKQPITHTVTLSDGTTVTLLEDDIKKFTNY